MLRKLPGTSAILIATAIVSTTFASEAGAAITRLAGGDTPVPNGQPGDHFGYIGVAAYDGDGYAFDGANSPQDVALGLYRGLIATPDVVAPVLDQSTNLPGAPGPLTTVFHLTKDQDSIAFYASAPVPGGSPYSGLFTQSSAGGPVVPIALRSDPIQPSIYHGIEDGFVYFEGTSSADSSVRGLYSVPVGGGSLTSIVDTSTPVPGQPGKTFEDFDFRHSGLSSGKLAFSATFDGGEGIYVVQPGQAPQVIYTKDTVLPTSQYGDELPDTDSRALGAPAYDGESLVFSAEFDTFDYYGEGFYLYKDGVIALVVDTETPVPGDPSKTFSNPGAGFYVGSAADYIVDDGRVFFDSNRGIYQFLDGEYLPIVISGQEIEDEILFGWGLPHASVSGDNLMFHGYTITPDGSSYTMGVFLVDIPEPSSVFLCLGVTGMYLTRRTTGQGRS